LPRKNAERHTKMRQNSDFFAASVAFGLQKPAPQETPVSHLIDLLRIAIHFSHS